MKRKFLIKGSATLCAAALLVSLTGTLAAPSTVHTGLWRGYYIVAGPEGKETIFQNEHGRAVQPISYNGTVYIPLRTAGEWMGGAVSWDQKTQTVSITTGGEPRYLSHADETQSTEAELNQYTDDLKHGIDITLRPDLTIQVDGEVRTFQNLKGEPVYPVVFRDVTYLPVRSIGELLGKKVLWMPNNWAPDDQLHWDYEYLMTKPAPHQLESVYLYDQPTEEQLEAVQGYIDGVNRIYRELVEAIQVFLVSEAMTQEETVAALEHICGYADQIRQLPSPDAPFFARHINWLNTAVDSLDVFRLDYDIAQVRDGSLSFEALVKNNSLGNDAMSALRNIRLALPHMQALLDQVREN